jgi:hypothetical protein
MQSVHEYRPCPLRVRLGSTFPGMGAVEFFSIALPAVFWPLVVALVALTQRKPIGRLIDRVRSGRVFGQEFDAPPPDLAEAAEGGASSPEVEEVIRSVSELSDGMQALLAGEEPLVPIPAALLARLSQATQNDEDRRRSEIERIMQSSARWGAQVARSRPNEVGDWAPFVLWKDDGEPEIVAIQGDAARTRLRQELEVAKHRYHEAFREHELAQRDVKEAQEAMRESSEPSAELQERVMSAQMREDVSAALVREAHRALQAKHRQVDLG